MVYYSQFTRDQAAAGRKKLWDPLNTLEILNKDSGYESLITCVGHAPSKNRRCQNRINKGNREYIMNTLNEMAYLQPNSTAVLRSLQRISGPALCLAYHQGQAESVVEQWKRKLPLLNPRIAEQKATKTIKTDEKNAVVKEESIDEFLELLRQWREQKAKLQEDLFRQQFQDDGSERGGDQDIKDRQKEELKRQRSEERDREAKKQEKARQEKERLEKERLEKERLEKEAKKQREREQAAQNERIRQRAQKAREEREREKCERETKEREEWNQSWKKYDERWVRFKSSGPGETNIRDAIPWPVKSGLYRDVTASNVKTFLQKAGEEDGNMSKLMRKECQKWHPDMIHRLIPASRLTGVDQIILDMICRVVTDLLNSSAGRSSEFLS
jgi:hypothetical protein